MSELDGTEVDVLIIGAGPTGLGAAARLEQRARGSGRADAAAANWLLVEALQPFDGCERGEEDAIRSCERLCVGGRLRPNMP